VIVVVMGAYDFVWGVFIGILLAFVSQVIQTSRISAIKNSYSGVVAGSTVRRNPGQREFLRRAGNQIQVTKLSGYLFFGTIVDVEEKMRALIDEENFNHRPIRYLIFDMSLVTGSDYSSSEAFNRLNRLFSKKGVTTVICGVDPEGPVGLPLRSVGLGEEGNKVALLPDLNQALESCENELLKAYYASQSARESSGKYQQSDTLSIPKTRRPSYGIDAQFSSPRREHLHRAAHDTINDTEANMQPKWQNFKEPLRLILQTFQGLTQYNEDFWFRAVPYFTRKEFTAGTILYERGLPANGFYLLQEGILRADYDEPQGHYYESIVAGTTCGELPFFSAEKRTATVIAERDCVTWRMDREAWDKLQKKEPDLANELLQIALKLTEERRSTIISFMMTRAN
jgi:SulP family sulfate permease